MENDKITIFGAGKIGGRLAFRAAVSGYTVIVFDINKEALTAAKDKLHELAVQHMQDHAIPEYETDKALGNISYSMTMSEAAGGADIVIEAIPRDMNLKSNFYRQLSRCASDKAVFITTSAIALSELAIESGRPALFMGLRLFNAEKKDAKAEITMLDGTDVKAFYHIIGFLESLGLEVLPIGVQ